MSLGDICKLGERIDVLLDCGGVGGRRYCGVRLLASFTLRDSIVCNEHVTESSKRRSFLVHVKFTRVFFGRIGSEGEVVIAASSQQRRGFGGRGGRNTEQ